MSKGKLIVQLHNFSSVSLCSDFIQIATAIGAKDIIFSQASGRGATAGVPLGQKEAMAKKANFFIFQDLSDTIELLKPDEVYLFIRRPFSQETFSPEAIASSYLEGKTILLVFGGSRPGLSKKDLELGKPIYFANLSELGVLGELTLGLYLIRTEIEKHSK
ncbi:MAG: RecB-family nuclease [Candidatus Heimdallarchaeaceae archaeon]